jgi:hypothetical protein
VTTPNESTLDWEKLVPPPAFMRVNQFAKWLWCTDTHIIRLIRSGEIEVPQELQKSAPSGPSMRIPRASIVKFLTVRSSGAWKADRKREREKLQRKRNAR